MTPMPKRVTTGLRRFRTDRRGVSAVEFALIMPLMLMLYAGSIEFSEALAVDRKATRVASTVGDLITQYSEISQSDVTDIMQAATAIMQPYSTAPLGVTVYAVTLKADGTQKVAWSYASGTATKPAKDGPPPELVPSEIMVAGTETVVTKVQYHFVSPFSSYMTGLLQRDTEGYEIEHSYTMRPRLGNAIDQK